MYNVFLILGGVGFNEILLISVVALVFFGAKRIPEFMKGMGKGVREFQDVMGDVKKEVNKEVSKVEKDMPDMNIKL